MSDTPRWLAGWYATRLHAVDRPFDPSSIRPIYAMCNAHVYASYQTEWAARRLAKNPPKCKRCLKLLGQADAPSEVEQLRAEIARLRLTDAEREAIQTAIDILTDPVCRSENKQTESLRGLLARHGGER